MILPRMRNGRVGSVVAVAALGLLLAGCADGAAVRAQQQPPLSLRGTWRAGLFTEGYGPQGLGPAVTASPSASASGSGVATGTAEETQRTLGAIGLVATDFATGYTVALIQDGATLKDKTLDFCGKTYATDATREARRQVVLLDPTSAPLGVLSESVLYRTPDDAAAALTELREALTTCDPQSLVPVGKQKFRVAQTSTSDLDVSGLVPEESRVALAVTLTPDSGTTGITTLSLYQVRGRLLVGLYFQHTGGNEFTSKDLANFHVLGAAIAARMDTQDESVVGSS